MIDFLAVLKAQVEQNLRDRQAGRERQNAGVRVSGSRKERAALRKIALNPGELLKAEASPAAAEAMVRKAQVFPRPDFEGWQQRKLDYAQQLSAPIAAFLFLLWKVFPDQPKFASPFARMAYVRLGRDLAAFVEKEVAEPYARTIDNVHHALLTTVFGWWPADVEKASSEANAYKATAPSAAAERTVLRMLPAVRRYLPADDFVRWVYRSTAESATWQQEDLRDLTRLLYDFPEPAGLAGEEPEPADLYAGEGDLFQAVTLWRFVGDKVLGHSMARRWLLTSYDAQRYEQNTGPRYSDYDSVPFTAYLPRLLDYYYSTTLASLLFIAGDHRMRPKTGWHGIDSKKRHPLLAQLAGLAEDDWANAATLLGLGPVATSFTTTTPKKKAENLERVTLTHIQRRGGVLVTDLQVHEQFLLSELGFRAVEYGNYVRDQEGTEHLRHSVCALVDLCDVLNFNPRRANEAGGLALAFGSRGNGGRAAATYYPSERIINLTKSNGDGSLAHEWLHYFDHLLYIHLTGAASSEPFASYYVAGNPGTMVAALETDEKGELYANRPRQLSRAKAAKAHQETKAARETAETARRDIKWTGFQEDQAREVQRLLSWLWQAIRFGHYTRGGELHTATPSAVVNSLAVSISKGRSFMYDLLSNTVFGTFQAAEKSQVTFGRDMASYVAQVRMGRQTQAWLWETMRLGRFGYGVCFTLGPTQTPENSRYAYIFRQIAFELGVEKVADVPFYRPVVSQFYQVAVSHPSAVYWANPAELFARSFERFVHDELAARGQANNYLVDPEKFVRAPGYYPQGSEAMLINEAWRNLFHFLSTTAGLGPFVASWADGQRVDEFLKLGTKTQAEAVTEGVITPAAPATSGAPDTEVFALADRARQLKMAQARVKIAAAARARAQAAEAT